MLKICITNLSVETIQTLGSINIGKTIISQNQASAAVLPPPPPATPSFLPDQETVASVPAPGHVFVSPAEVSPGQVGEGVSAGAGGVGSIGAS